MTLARSGPAFSIQEIPFSYHGSWLNLSPVIGEKTYAEDLHLVSHQTRLHPVLRLVPLAGDTRAPATIDATPAQLTWRHQTGRIEATYHGTDTIRIRGTGLGLQLAAADPRLTPFRGAYLYRDPIDGSAVYTVYETGRRYRITVLHGQCSVIGAEATGETPRAVHLPAGGAWEIAIEEYESARQPYTPTQSFDALAAATAQEFRTFLDAVAPWRSTETPAAALAAYVLWSATVRPAGFLTRPAVLMSKHWMDKVWSWDHCFNALALAPGAPDLAWHQFRLPFDHQDPTGALPDSVTHSEILYNFVKPPIHGWTLHQLRHQLPTPIDPTEIYQPLADWTTFWLTHRRAPTQHLPHYHHGNDSGWDNATTFDPHRLIQTADLAAFLILQLRELATLAAGLGRHDHATSWTRTADHITAEMTSALWTSDRYVARAVASGHTWSSTSLLDLMPIVLGPDLPATTRTALAGRIEAHLTPYGLATEHPSSPHYQADGYWRGPIWAP
ncbi:MAG TPA: glycogen debranching protein, partial [Rugosimonospora sp.]|nr:glycogen debranching protein [Rugosimonospora sp.]